MTDRTTTKDACMDCVNRLRLKATGFTGSWSPTKCDFCGVQDVGYIVEVPDGERQERGEK